RHDALVGSDHEHGQVYAAHAGQHVLDESFVAGDVHDLDGEVRLLDECEAQVDRDAASLLLGEAVGVGARQRLHQRGLAVVDVPGGADDDVAGAAHSAEAATRALTRPATWPGSTVRQSRNMRSSTRRPITGGSPARSRASSVRAAASVAP